MTESPPPAESFETHLVRLEEIVDRLEADGVSLDEALRLFEEGVARLREASAVLERADGEVRRLVEGADGTFSLASLRD